MLFQHQARPTSCFRVWVIPSSDQQVDSAHPSTSCPPRSLAGLAVQRAREADGRSLGLGCRLAQSHHWQRAIQPSNSATPPSCSRPQKPSR